MPDTLDLCQVTPTEINIDIAGAAIEGGRSMSGLTQAINYSGGGYVVVTYGGINIMSRDQHRYWNTLAGILNGGATRMFVPLWTDMLLEPTETYTDKADVVTTAPALFATAMTILPTGFTPRAGMWFSINHGGALDWRAYRIVTAAAAGGGAYDITIRPPLRAAVAIAADVCKFNRPLCSMRLAAGESLPWSWTAPGALGQGVIPLVEHF